MSTPLFSNPQGSVLSVLVPATNLVQFPTGWQTMPLVGADNGNGTASVSTSPTSGTTARVTAGGIAPGQTIKNYSGTITLSAAQQTINLETVTTGKSYLITDVVLTTNDTATGSFLVSITFAGAATVNAFINATKGLEMLGIETQPTATSGQVVAIVVPVATVGKLVAYNVYGVEQ